MIQGVSAKSSCGIAFGQDQKSVEKSAEKKGSPVKPYFDSFVKNAKQSAPVLLACTAVLTASEHAAKKTPILNSIENNLKGFFAPVLIGTSVLLSVIENKKTSKNEKQEKQI